MEPVVGHGRPCVVTRFEPVELRADARQFPSHEVAAGIQLAVESRLPGVARIQKLPGTERLIEPDPRDHDIERFYRDVRLFRIYEGTTQIQQIVIARNMVRELTQ